MIESKIGFKMKFCLLSIEIQYVYLTGGAKQQTDPPSVPIIDLFPNAEGLEGEILEYPLAKDGFV